MKKILIGIAILLLLGGGAYFLTKGDDDANQAETQTNTQTSTDNQSSSGSNFSPVSTEGQDFVATITTSSTAGTSTAKFEQDGSKTRYTLSSNGQESQFVYTKDFYYSCSSGTCYKFPISQSSSSGVDAKSYSYTQEQLASYKNSATSKGRQDCPGGGTCEVWSVGTTTASTTLYIDVNNQRIRQVESTIGGATSKITYEYKDVTIAIPANAKSLPTTP